MRTLLLSFLLLSILPGFTQDDDHPDYRSKKDFFIRIREKDVRDDVATFARAGLDESIGKVPLKTIPMKELGSTSILFEGEGIRVTIKLTPFLESRHKLGYYDEKKYLLKIDNKGYYGSYGKPPKYAIESVTVTVNGDSVAIPPIAYNDIYDPAITYKDASGVERSMNRVYVSANKRNIYIYLLDRTLGGTEVTWVIQDKKYLRRVLDFGFLK